MTTRTITIAGRRYKVSTRSYDDCLYVTGKGLVGGLTLDGISISSPDLRGYLMAGIAEYRKRSKAASEMIQQRLRDGKAGLRS